MKAQTAGQIQLREKIIVVSSGKGGVGKSTTSVNLAIFAARKSLRVGLLDMDPLSDIATLLDVPAETLKNVPDKLAPAKGDSFKRYAIPIFPRLDLVFPHTKLARGEPGVLKTLIFETFVDDLAKAYDILIFDMPAGIGHEENLAFLPYVRNLVVVTNAEPTSHVSAGGYIKAATEINPELKIFLWHNKFENMADPDFNPRTLFDNYNRYVPEDLRLGPELRERMIDIAFVPFDASLDLLKADAEYYNHLLGKFSEVLTLLEEQVVAEIPEQSGVPKPLRVILRHLVLHSRGKLDLNAALQFFRSVLSQGDFEFPLDQRLYVERYLAVQNAHPLRKLIESSRQAIRSLLDALSSDGSLFGPKSSGDDVQRRREFVLRRLRELIAFLASFHLPSGTRKAPWPAAHAPMVKNASGLLLFYYALYKLMENTGVQALLSSFVPHRKTRDGRRYRDRYRQIRSIVEQDKEYHLRYFQLIKRLFPLVRTQLSRLSANDAWNSLLYLDRYGEAMHNVYLKLLSRTVHDLVNGGLGVYVGVQYNVAANAIREGGESLLSKTR